MGMNILLAGTPSTTVLVAEALVRARHTISTVLCPFPNLLVGKDVDTLCCRRLGAKRSIPVINVDKEGLQNKTMLNDLPAIDVLIVADFGYLIRLAVALPKIRSAKYSSLSCQVARRGSGSFTILFGDRETGVVYRDE